MTVAEVRRLIGAGVIPCLVTYLNPFEITILDLTPEVALDQFCGWSDDMDVFATMGDDPDERVLYIGIGCGYAREVEAAVAETLAARIWFRENPFGPPPEQLPPLDYALRTRTKSSPVS
jgi:hypothetical protein